jgi:membrane-associated phospholipid phosphatase
MLLALRKNLWCRPLVWALSCAFLTGCAALPGTRRWGEDVTISPGWARVRAAAVQAARDPWVWAPLAGAAGLQINGWDRQVSAWAIRETPIFGSPRRAVNWSDDLRSVAVISHAVTVLLVPGGDDARTWMVNKARGYALDMAAVGVANGITHVLKAEVGRTRPSRTDNLSFPSGHTTSAATFDRLAARNLEYFDVTAAARQRLTIGLDTLTIATAWARVEAGAHYPSDTLFSMALGNFSANFFRNTFVETDGERKQDLAVIPIHEGLMLYYAARF